METLRFSVWQLLVEAMALTSIAAMIALLGSMLLARGIVRLTSFERVNSRVATDRPLRGVDQRFMALLQDRSSLD